MCYFEFMWNPATALTISPDQHAILEQLVRAGSTPQKLVERSQIILSAAEGMANNAIAKILKTSRPTVLLWRERFERMGLACLEKDAPRPGRKPKIPPDKVAKVIEATLQTKPPAATHWSIRTMAKAQGLGRMTIQRIWSRAQIKPHLTKTFKLSRDKHFVEKLTDVVGLYLNPPDRAIVLCVDEKSQIQALDRTQPGLPLKKGRCGTMTHDYKRNGTTTLFAALSMVDGRIIGDCMPRHRHQEFIRFLEKIDAEIAVGLDLHLIVDNYGTHKHPRVKSWIRRHPRFHLHFIPTSSSWLNMVERWFREITDKRIRRGVFRNVPELIAAIEQYIMENNKSPKPFVWTASVQSILEKIRHCKEALGTLH
jgi:transposase